MRSVRTTLAAVRTLLPLLAGSIASTAAAQGPPLNFTDVCAGQDGFLMFERVWEVGAYRFTFSFDGGSAEFWLACSPNAGTFGWTGVPHAMTGYVGPETVTLDRIDGAPFSVSGLDLIPLFHLVDTPITFTGVWANGFSTSRTVTLPEHSFGVRQTYAFGREFAGVNRLVYSATRVYGWTNLQLATVPEPSTAALLAVGAAAVSGVAWRRKRAQA